MRYQGGKFRQSAKIVELLEQYRKPNQIFLEPFVGAANIVSKMSGMRIASDIHADLITMYQALQTGWEPPNTLSKEEYELCKNNKELLSPQFRAFVGFGCSYGGKWFGGFASEEGRDITNECYRGLLKQKENFLSVAFTCGSYDQWNPYNMLIYCDPPYAGTTVYDGVSSFNTNKFWETMYQWSKQDNTIFVSEYTAPFNLVKEVYRWNTKTTLVHKGEGLERVDKLFLIQPEKQVTFF